MDFLYARQNHKGTDSVAHGFWHLYTASCIWIGDTLAQLAIVSRTFRELCITQGVAEASSFAQGNFELREDGKGGRELRHDDADDDLLTLRVRLER